MATTKRPDLLAADPAEISELLLEAGQTGIRTWRQAWVQVVVTNNIRRKTLIEALNITTDQGDAAIDPILAAFSPQTSGFDPARPGSGAWRALVPPELRPHLVHLRDYRNAVRAGTPPVTTAQTQHVIADIIDAIRLLVRDDVG